MDATVPEWVAPGEQEVLDRVRPTSWAADPHELRFSRRCVPVEVALMSLTAGASTVLLTLRGTKEVGP
jgi:hypothetical protein